MGNPPTLTGTFGVINDNDLLFTICYTTHALNFKMLIIFVLLSSSVTATALINASMTPALMRDMSTLYLVHQKDGQAGSLEGFDWSHKKIRYTYGRFADKNMELKGIIILLENLNCLLTLLSSPIKLLPVHSFLAFRTSSLPL